jgi:sec-independent protein translocase protein TatC
MDENNDFWTHIEELRRKTIFLVILFISAAIAAFFFMDEILKLLQAPLKEYGVNLYYREPPEKFFTYCRASLYCSMFALIPAAGLQIYSFVMPALLGKERVFFSTLLLSGIFLFFVGISFAWFIMIPFVIDFFINFASGDGISPLWGISDYVGIILMIMFVTGIIFELPIFLFALLKSGIVTVKTMEGYRRHFIVAFFIVAAIVTPPDVFTQIVVGLLLYAMFESTLIIVKLLGRKNDEQA